MEDRDKFTASTLRISTLVPSPEVAHNTGRSLFRSQFLSTIRLCRMELCQLIVLKQENVINDRMEDTLTLIHRNPHSDRHTPITKGYTDTHKVTQKQAHTQTHTHTDREPLMDKKKQTHRHTHTNSHGHTETNTPTETQSQTHTVSLSYRVTLTNWCVCHGKIAIFQTLSPGGCHF